MMVSFMEELRASELDSKVNLTTLAANLSIDELQKLLDQKKAA